MDDTNRDEPRHAATSRDNDYTLSLDEVSERYAKAGHARTIRTLQRYCASGHLDAQKVATTTGDKYLVTSQSVARHIAQIEELAALEAVASGRDLSRHVASTVGIDKTAENQQETGSENLRQGTTGEGDVSRYVVLLEREVEKAKDERDFLHEQINRKDKTIDSLIERDRETNVLIRGLQEMLTPLLIAPKRESPHPEQSPEN
jgi:hypothetical protein